MSRRCPHLLRPERHPPPHERRPRSQVQQNALTALLADPERLNALPIDKLERMLDMQRAHAWRLTAKADFRCCFSARVQSIKPKSVPMRGRIDYGRDKEPDQQPTRCSRTFWKCSARSSIEGRLTYSVSNTECPIKGEVDVRISAELSTRRCR